MEKVCYCGTGKRGEWRGIGLDWLGDKDKFRMDI